MNNALPYLVPTFAVAVGIILQWKDGSAIRAEIASLRAEFNNRFAEVNARFATFDAKFAEMNTRFTALDAKFDRRFDNMTTDSVQLHERIAKVEAAQS